MDTDHSRTASSQGTFRATDRLTVLQVGTAQAALGYTLSSLGACLALLARDLRTAPESLAWMSSSFGIGLILVGAVGTIALRRGSWPVLRTATFVTGTGASLLATAASPPLAVIGALLLGVGAAGLVLVTPALLHGPGVAAALSRVTGASSVTGILAPLAIGGLDSVGPSGRLALLLAVPPLFALAIGAGPSGHPRLRDDRSVVASGPDQRTHPLPVRQLVQRWAAVALAVSIEFCFTFWAVARMLTTGLPTGAAAIAASGFLVGMATGRAGIPRLLARGAPVVVSGCALAAAGTIVISVANSPVSVTAGLVLAGLGISGLYPATLGHLVRLRALPAARSAALGTLASGIAILFAPTALAAVGAAVELRFAFPITVIPLTAVLAMIWYSRRQSS
ncbi:MAG: hypothetical protein JOZ47_04020 [Kutzneria sp.]|nr:hypothetical protein [Kutzneria sp.]MBV9844228.1 hypothetical protein [Kutzneria sp.]